MFETQNINNKMEAKIAPKKLKNHMYLKICTYLRYALNLYEYLTVHVL